ncbi:hypothetical protein M8J76_017106 [Diaphorina citri]|nr:hypothetical protein M8J76_017106 [Diaphorina citri]KAI5742918.1 hypothetical protein M8J77_012608 [Diaphorina citri]
MQFFVAFVATLACAFASPSGYGYAPHGGYYGGYASYAYAPVGYAKAYAYDPPAPIVVKSDGFLADTPDVAHAKAAHLTAKAEVAAKAAAYAPAPYAYAAPAYAPYAYAAPAYAPVAYAAPYSAAYVAPYAKAYAGAYAYGPAHITVLPNGYLADTPEVAHSKAAHEVAKGYVAAAAAANPDYDSHSYKYAYAPAPYVYAAPKYYGAHH